MTKIRYSIDNLHDDIAQSEIERMISGYSRKVVEVIHPGKGMGDSPNENLVDIVYECSGKGCSNQRMGHTHGAVYGPEILAFHDECKICGKAHYHHSRENHDWIRERENEYDFDHFTLYAD
jgi:hypothetical protein